MLRSSIENRAINLSEPENELNLRVKGWTKENFNRLLTEFKKLHYEEINDLVESLGIRTTGPTSGSEEAIFYIIADDWCYDQLKEEIDKILEIKKIRSLKI